MLDEETVRMIRTDPEFALQRIENTLLGMGPTFNGVDLCESGGFVSSSWATALKELLTDVRALLTKDGGR